MDNKPDWRTALVRHVRDEVSGRHLLAVACIVLLGVGLYANTLGNGFVMDDRIVVENNSFISSWSNLKYLFDPAKYFAASGEMTYRPVTTLSYLWDYSFWKYNPSGYHFTNLILHITSGVLLYFILLSLVSVSGRTGLAPPGEGGTILLAPLIAALFFISHPAQTEGVDFIGGRHDILMAMFYFAAVFSYQKAVNARSGLDTRFYALSLLAYALSCLSKEPGITLPAVLILVDAFTCPEKDRAVFWKKRIALYAGFCVVALIFVSVRSMWMVLPGEYLETGQKRFPIIGGILFTYLKMLVFPQSLSAEHAAGPGYHEKIPDSFAQPEVYMPTAIVLFTAVVVLLARRRFPMVFFGGLWFAITMLPSSNIFFKLTSFPMREKYIYLPAAGFYMAAAFILCQVAEKAALRRSRPQVARLVAAAAAALLVSIYSVCTVIRNSEWKDGVSLWTATIKTSPGSYRAYYNLGMSYEYERGDTPRAIEAFKESIRNYDFPDTHDALGAVYLRNEFYADALRELTIANTGNSELGSAYYHLGLLYLAKGDPDKAIEIQERGFREAKDAYPYFSPVPVADMHDVLGKAYLAKKDLDKAVEEFGISLSLRPGDPEVSYSLGSTYVLKGLFDKASECFLAALKAEPYNIQVRYALANVYLKMKAFDKAEREYLRVLSIDPAQTDSRNNLANIYYSKGRIAKAVAEYQKVLETDPAHFRARNNLANIYLIGREYDKAIAEYGKVIASQPGSPVAHYNLGLAFEGKGMMANAEDEWRAALRIDPGFTPAAEALRQSAEKRSGGK